MFEEFDDQESLDKLNYYLEIGAISFAGYNEEGEAIFELNEDKTKELAPELWESHLKHIDDTLLNLYKDGLVEVEYDEDLNAIMHFSEEGYRIAKEKGAIPLEGL